MGYTVVGVFDVYKNDKYYGTKTMFHDIDKKKYKYYSKYLDKDGYLKLKELDLKDENITYKDFYYVINRAYLEK